MTHFLSDLSKGVLSIIYPALCEICQEKIDTETGYDSLCKDCINKIKTLEPAPRPKCSNNINVWAVCGYEGVAKDCIHLFKYNNRLNLSRPLAGLMSSFTDKNLADKKFDVIIPVPLHKTKMRERGFNQAELLARRLAKNTNCPLCTDAIKRIKPTISQTGLSKTKRFTNIRGAFKITDNNAVGGKNILLIDDVFTTGSTINEAAKTLLKSGAKSVEALVLARGIQ